MTLRFVFAHRRQVLLGAAAGLLLSSRAAAEAGSPQGDEEAAKYQLVYDAPSECPSKREFLAQIQRRIQTPWQAESGNFTGTLSVAVSQIDGRYQAHMTLADRWGHVAFRNLEAENCSDAVTDVAVAAVAAIETWLGPQPAFFEFGITTGPDWRTAQLAWGGAAMLGLRWPTSRRSLKLLLGYWASGAGPANVLPDVNIHFRLFSARIELCPIELGLGRHGSIPLCGSGELGLLAARHAEVIGSPPPLAAWGTIGVSPQLRWSQKALFLQFGPRADLLLYPRSVMDTPARGGQQTQNEKVHRFPLIGFALMATIGWGVP